MSAGDVVAGAFRMVEHKLGLAVGEPSEPFAIAAERHPQRCGESTP